MNKFRRRILEKLAQTTPDSLPTEEVAQTTSVSGSPPSFTATDYYPGIIVGFTARNATIINRLSDLINQSLYYTSNGKVHLPWMRSINFNFGTSAIPSLDLKNLMGFAKQLYNQIYMPQGQPDDRPLTAVEIADRLAPLKNSSFLINLPVTSPTGQLATKVGGNIKTLITNYLLQIK